jgi:hypothetical protein
MKVGQPRIRYLLGGANLRLVEWLTIVGRLIGRKVPRWQVSYPLALIVALCQRMGSRSLHRPNADGNHHRGQADAAFHAF